MPETLIGNTPRKSLHAAVDTSVLIGLVNSFDHWHRHTTSLYQFLFDNHIELVYFDCVVGETLSTILRRFAEQSRSAEVERLFEQVNTHVPVSRISWSLPKVPDLYN